MSLPPFQHSKMNIEIANATDLLRRLIASFTHKHQQLELETQEQPDGFRFFLCVHTDDYPKVVGKQGGTLKALAFILREIGLRESRKPYMLHLIEPETRNRGPENIITPPEDYDPAEACELLTETVEALVGEGFCTVTVEQVDDGFKFTIISRDTEALTKSYANDRNLNAITALQRIWKSYAGCVGLHFYVELKSA